MKIIKQGAVAVAGVKWWLGKKVICGVCGCEAELEATDNVASLTGHDTRRAEIACCMGGCLGVMVFSMNLKELQTKVAYEPAEQRDRETQEPLVGI
jgi:hypothetical protein